MPPKILEDTYYSLRRLWAEYQSIAISRFRNRIVLFFMLFYPALFIIIFGFVFGGAAQQEFQLYYFNADLQANGQPTASSELLLSHIETNLTQINLKEVEINLTRTSPVEWMQNQEVRALLTIPNGWEENITNPSPTIQAQVFYYYDPAYTSTITVLELLEKTVQEMNSELLDVTQIIQTNTITTPSRQDLSMIDFYVPGVTMITISTSGLISFVNYLNSEKRSGQLYKKSSSPLRKWEWSLAKIFWDVTFGLITSFVTIITATLLFGFKISMLHPLMLPLIFFGCMTFSGIGLIFGRLITNPDAVNAASMIFSFPQMFLAGALFPLEMMPNFIQILAKFFPLYYITEGMRDLMLPSTYHQVWPNLGITIAMGVGFFVLGVLISDWKKE
ncbi:MAG: hypothetical protein GF308_15800 [Candidatus Heimdallarchaeota archaeon]|nr:hypothetical protein [Candidatus Heimdallarchaeota archaeon]